MTLSSKSKAWIFEAKRPRMKIIKLQLILHGTFEIDWWRFLTHIWPSLLRITGASHLFLTVWPEQYVNLKKSLNYMQQQMHQTNSFLAFTSELTTRLKNLIVRTNWSFSLNFKVFEYAWVHGHCIRNWDMQFLIMKLQKSVIFWTFWAWFQNQNCFTNVNFIHQFLSIRKSSLICKRYTLFYTL